MSAPGWYPDPQMPGQLRWWDGSTWTAHVASPTAAVPPPGPPPAPSFGPTPTPAGPTSGAAGQPGFPPVAPGAVPGAPASSRRGWIIGLSIAGAAVVLLLIVVVLSLVVYRSTGPTAAPTTTAPRAATPTTAEPRAETPALEASDLTERADAAGIPVLDEEGSATHTHTLLRILVDGDEIVIPAGIGIDARAGQITAVHTHEDTGVLHVESPHRNDVYTVGQFLTLWGVAETDEDLCTTLAESPCTVTYAVVAPTRADELTFEQFGPLPATPPTEPAGRDTELAQGAVIEIRLDTAA